MELLEKFNKLNNKLAKLVDENKKLKQQYKNIQEENQELKKKIKEEEVQSQHVLNLVKQKKELEKIILNLEKEKSSQLEIISQNLDKALDKLELNEVKEGETINENNESKPTIISSFDKNDICIQNEDEKSKSSTGSLRICIELFECG